MTGRLDLTIEILEEKKSTHSLNYHLYALFYDTKIIFTKFCPTWVSKTLDLVLRLT